jgi:hypothetical protein
MYIDKITDDIIMINNFETELNSTCSGTKHLKGTFIIKVHNCVINGQNLKFLEKPKAIAI